MAGGNKTSQGKANSISKIKKAANLYVNLFSCPSFYEKLYQKAIFGQKSRILLLASNIIKKEVGELKLKALKIFSKISAVFRLKNISCIHVGSECRWENIMEVINLKSILNHRMLFVILKKKYFAVKQSKPQTHLLA